LRLRYSVISGFDSSGVSPETGSTTQISLGTAQAFGVLGASTVTNTGPTVVNGNVGLTPGSSVTGFPPGTVVSGAIQINNAAALQAKVDINNAFTNINAMPCSATFGAAQDISLLSPINAAATPVLCFTSSALMTGPVTITGASGDSIVFKIGSTLTVSNNATATLAGGISCDQVLWGVGSSATLGTNSTFVGDILALASVTLNTGASSAGRAFALNGAVTLDTNVVTPCSISALAGGVSGTPTLSEWGLIILAALMMILGLRMSRRRGHEAGLSR
jgi:ice-binding like protein/exosortase sorting signal-containing protein